MKIIQKVIVKQVLTENSKAKLIDYYNKQKRNLAQEKDQLYFEQKKVMHKNKYQTENVTAYFEQEINLREEKMKLVDFQLNQLDILPLESEIKERELDAIVEVDIGDNWDERMLAKTIIVKDDTIIDIR